MLQIVSLPLLCCLLQNLLVIAVLQVLLMILPLGSLLIHPPSPAAAEADVGTPQPKRAKAAIV